MTALDLSAVSPQLAAVAISVTSITNSSALVASHSMPRDSLDAIKTTGTTDLSSATLFVACSHHSIHKSLYLLSTTNTVFASLLTQPVSIAVFHSSFYCVALTLI